MCDGNWTAIRNLPFEDRDDTATTTKHISKTDNSEGTFVVARGIEYDHFRQAFRGTVDTCRAYCLICGDDHKSLDVGSKRGLHNVTSPHNIVCHGFNNVRFHQWNMLVCRCMKDNLWL